VIVASHTSFKQSVFVDRNEDAGSSFPSTDADEPIFHPVLNYGEGQLSFAFLASRESLESPYIWHFITNQ
jgi:hypothetical protein